MSSANFLNKDKKFIDVELVKTDVVIKTDQINVDIQDTRTDLGQKTDDNKLLIDALNTQFNSIEQSLSSLTSAVLTINSKIVALETNQQQIKEYLTILSGTYEIIDDNGNHVVFQ